jgi:hypothetical protein
MSSIQGTKIVKKRRLDKLVMLLGEWIATAGKEHPSLKGRTISILNGLPEKKAPEEKKTRSIERTGPVAKASGRAKFCRECRFYLDSMKKPCGKGHKVRFFATSTMLPGIPDGHKRCCSDFIKNKED